MATRKLLRLISKHIFSRHHSYQRILKRRTEHIIKRKKHTLSQDASFGFLFDIDGVIVRGQRVLPSAREAFQMITDSNGRLQVPGLFVTNAGNMLRQKKAEQLSDWLDIQVDTDQVIMSHSPMKMFHQFHDMHVLVSGQGPIKEIASYLGFTHVTTVDTLRSCFTHLDKVDHNRRKAAPCAFEKYFPRIDAVVLFGEPVRWETNLQLIIDILMTNGQPGFPPKELPYPHLPVLACNMDLLWMAEAPTPRFGHGCFLLCLESLYQKITGHELKYTALIGKPSELTYHHAAYLFKQQALNMGMAGVKRIYCIGDNPETDIYGSNLYNRYLQKLAQSHQKRSTTKVLPSRVAQLHGSQKVTTVNDSAIESDSDSDIDRDLSVIEGEVTDDSKYTITESCESILVCTGVYCKESDLLQYQGSNPSNHNHRDFVLDKDLKQPRYVVENVHEAVKMVYKKEGIDV